MSLYGMHAEKSNTYSSPKKPHLDTSQTHSVVLTLVETLYPSIIDITHTMLRDYRFLTVVSLVSIAAMLASIFISHWSSLFFWFVVFVFAQGRKYYILFYMPYEYFSESSLYECKQALRLIKEKLEHKGYEHSELLTTAHRDISQRLLELRDRTWPDH
jgi:hypothetical protein